jgi:hypothetical protein
MSVTLDRVSAIATCIHNQCANALGLINDLDETRELAKATAENLSGQRMTIMASIAGAAVDGVWTEGEVKAAVAAARKMINDQESRSGKTLATFISEINVAAHPKVRGSFEAITTVIESLWEQEREAIAVLKAEAVAPVTKLFKRKYHAIMGVMRALKDGEYNGEICADGVRDYAIEHDPDHDAEKVAKRLEAIQEKVAGMCVDFPHDELILVRDYLGMIDVKALQAARVGKLAEQARALEGAEKPAERPLIAAPVSTPAKVEVAVQPAQKGFRKAAKPENVTAPVTVPDIDALLNDAMELAA